MNDYEFLSDLCWEHLSFWLEELQIKTKIIRASQLPVKGYKSDLILQICKYCKADHYISGIHGKNYLEIDKFLSEGIIVEFQEFMHPQYPQLYGDFLPFMGIVDFCMNTHEVSLITGGR